MTELQKWQKTAERELKQILKICMADQRIKRNGPKSVFHWDAHLKVCGLQAMCTVNFKYRNIKEPTDVLSFPAQDFYYAHGFLGDLLICLPILKKQARLYKHSERQELRVLLIHGVLHLLGFDHEMGPKEAIQMQKLEKKILGKTAGLIERTVTR